MSETNTSTVETNTDSSETDPSTSGTDRPPEPIFELGNVFLASQALMVADELGLFPAVEQAGGMTREDIEAEFEFPHHHGVRDFLDVLVAHDLLVREGETYRLSDLSRAYLLPERDTYVGDYLTLSRYRMYESAAKLDAALETGEPQNELDDGESLYEDGELYASEENREGFQNAMRSLSAFPTKWIAEEVDWSQFDTVCDLGTAKGTMARRIAEASDRSVVGFDLPDAEPGFQSYTAESDAAERLSFHPGNFFEDSLPEADAYVYGHILNDWDTSEKEFLVEKAYEHLPSGGALFVHETMLDDERAENRFGLYMNMVTLVELQGGYCATVGEYEELLSDVGFERVERREIPGSETLVVGWKE
jgi:hypothetical protein